MSLVQNQRHCHWRVALIRCCWPLATRSFLACQTTMITSMLGESKQGCHENKDTHTHVHTMPLKRTPWLAGQSEAELHEDISQVSTLRFPHPHSVLPTWSCVYTSDMTMCPYIKSYFVFALLIPGFGEYMHIITLILFHMSEHICHSRKAM